MQYYTRITKNRKKAKIAHIWNGDNTLCKILNNPNLNHDKFQNCNSFDAYKMCKICSLKYFSEIESFLD